MGFCHLFSSATSTAVASPLIQFRLESIDGAPLVVPMPVDGHCLPLFPALHGGYIAVKVYRDFLPRIQPVLRRPRAWGLFSHLHSLKDSQC